MVVEWDLLIMFYVFLEDEVCVMVVVGVDIIVVYLGFIIGGFIGVEIGVLLEEVFVLMDVWVVVVLEVNLDVIVFVYGGFVVMLEDVVFVF